VRTHQRQSYVRFGQQFRVNDGRTLIQALHQKGFAARTEQIVG
jgi:hypothetical protein